MTAIETIAKAVASQDKDDDRASKKEKERMKKQPFQTMIEPFSKKTLDELRGWKPPGGSSGDDAYILFEKKMIERGDTAPDTIVYTLHVLLVGSRPEQAEKVRYNVQVKGMKILHWDRFPKVNDSNPRRKKLADMHFNPTAGKCAYDMLEQAIKHYAYDTESSLAERLAAAEAKNQSLEQKLLDKRTAAGADK